MPFQIRHPRCLAFCQSQAPNNFVTNQKYHIHICCVLHNLWGLPNKSVARHPLTAICHTSMALNILGCRPTHKTLSLVQRVPREIRESTGSPWVQVREAFNCRLPSKETKRCFVPEDTFLEQAEIHQPTSQRRYNNLDTHSYIRR
jgi:hypothetical protein